MTDISKEAVDALVPLLNYGVCQDQYDDVEIYETEQLMKKAAQSLAALRAALDEAEAREAALLAANEINRETLLRHNADCDRRIRKAEAERDEMEVEARAHIEMWGKALRERDAANALLRAFASAVGSYEADMHPMTRDSFNRVSAHLGAKP